MNILEKKNQLIAQNKSSKLSLFFWLIASFSLSFWYSWLAFSRTFNQQFIIQDDARQHIFWLRRYLNPELFPDDLIANYFQSVAPSGYKFFYATLAQIGFDPVNVSQVLPIILGLITTGFCFAVAYQLLPIPSIGFIATTLLNQNLWMQDGLISATPKAFIYPIFLAFLCYWLKKSLFGISLSIILLAYFYPSLVLLCSVLLVLQFWQWSDKSLKFNYQRENLVFCCTGLIVACLSLLPYVISAAEFAPIITVEQARALPEFQAGKRASFFDNNLWDFWFNGGRSGLRITSAFLPPLTYSALLLPVLWRLQKKFILIGKVIAQFNILIRLILASLVMFSVAHIFLFKFHLPSRYTQHSFKIVVILAASISLILLIQKINDYLAPRWQILPITILLGILISYPASLDSFIWTGYVTGNYTKLYKFLEQQPTNIVVASLAEEANNIPSFAQRSILVSSEYAIPYHWGYYQQFRQRTKDLIAAQYTEDVALINNFISTYKINFWLIESKSFSPTYLQESRWLKTYKLQAKEVNKKLINGVKPLLLKLKAKCQVVEDKELTLISTKCLQSSF